MLLSVDRSCRDGRPPMINFGGAAAFAGLTDFAAFALFALFAAFAVFALVALAGAAFFAAAGAFAFVVARFAAFAAFAFDVFMVSPAGAASGSMPTNALASAAVSVLPKSPPRSLLRSRGSS